METTDPLKPGETRCAPAGWMLTQDAKCADCMHWTQKGKPTGSRLCRHPDALLNSAKHKQCGSELVMHTGPNFSCARHELAAKEPGLLIIDDPELRDICNQGYKPGDPVIYDDGSGPVIAGEAQEASSTAPGQCISCSHDILAAKGTCKAGHKKGRRWGCDDYESSDATSEPVVTGPTEPGQAAYWDPDTGKAVRRTDNPDDEAEETGR